MVDELFVQAMTKVPAGSPATNGLPRSLREDRSTADPQLPPAGWSAPYTGTGFPSPVYWPNATMTLPVLSIAVSIPAWLPTSQATGVPHVPSVPRRAMREPLPDSQVIAAAPAAFMAMCSG